MSFGSSIFLIAVGAILRYAITTSVSGVSLQTVGLILIIVGIVGLVISLLWMFVLSSRPAAGYRGRVRDPYYYDDPPRV